MKIIENMVQDWPDKVRDYCRKKKAIREICITFYASMFEGLP
jgi:hypothetical protein